MSKLKTRLQRYRDLQDKKHQKYLEAKQKVNKYQQDSYRLLWKIEQTKESQEELLVIHLPNLVQELLKVLLTEFVFVMKYTKKV
jgi:hypothetical protein